MASAGQSSEGLTTSESVPSADLAADEGFLPLHVGILSQDERTPFDIFMAVQGGRKVLFCRQGTPTSLFPPGRKPQDY